VRRKREVIYPDASVLIAFASGYSPATTKLARLVRSGATFVTSNLLELETVPSTLYARKPEAHAVLTAFFARWRPRRANAATVQLAARECELLPLGSMDALHLAAAHQAGATIFLTLEKMTKPMHQSKIVPVVHLDRA
jgi:predicted nucleic acid-binding protein